LCSDPAYQTQTHAAASGHDLAHQQHLPKRRRWDFLQTVADRLDREAAEAKEVLRGFAGSSPSNFAILAPLGTGKTFCILMVVGYMQEVLHRTVGVDFQTVASQNRMAMRVGGCTTHPWAEAPIDVDKIADFQKKKKIQKYRRDGYVY